jgi:hypothetical protein
VAAKENGTHNSNLIGGLPTRGACSKRGCRGKLILRKITYQFLAIKIDNPASESEVRAIQMKPEQSDEEVAYRAGVRLGKVVSEACNNEPPIKQVMAIARDVLPEYPILMDAALYTFSQPGFKPLLSKPAIAIRHAHKASLIQTLEKIFAPGICSQLSSFLDGFLGFDRSSHLISSHEPLGDLPGGLVVPRDESIQSSDYSETESYLNRSRQSSKTVMPAPQDCGVANKRTKTYTGTQLLVTVGGILIAIVVVLAARNIPTSNNPEARPESMDCNAKRGALEQKAMALPPYNTTNDEMYFTQPDGEVLSPWEAGGKTWQSVYSPLTAYDHSRPKSLSAEQISFIDSANEYKKRCD